MESIPPISIDIMKTFYTVFETDTTIMVPTTKKRNLQPNKLGIKTIRTKATVVKDTIQHNIPVNS